jgi:hypothetical protein
MTIDEYWDAVRRLGLQPSGVSGVFFTPTHDPQQVPDPTEQTPEQRTETIEILTKVAIATPEEPIAPPAKL